VSEPKWYIHRLQNLYSPGCGQEQRVTLPNGTVLSRYVRAVCVPYTAGSLFAAWEVLRGRAFAFEWPKPGDLEAILDREREQCQQHEVTP
jgi:hypothetical protein